MIILYIAGLSDKKFAGPNINVPANVIYGETYATVGLYNTGVNAPESVKQIKNYFDKDKMANSDISTLPKPFNSPDIVVFNSMYLRSHVQIAKKLIKKGIPYIIIPRGALTRKAQEKKKMKKRIGNILMFNKYVKYARAIQFLTENEYEESKNFKFKDYMIAGNGTVKKDKVKEYKDKNQNTKFVITFIGRLEKFHKGLDVLVEAVNIGKKEIRNNNIIVNLYGPDEDGTIEYINNRCKEYEIEDLINLNGPVFGEKKEEVLLGTDLFIHTSRLEGHPTSIIEAISYGIPVLVTPGTNVANEVKDNNLGFVAELNSKSILEKILIAFENKNNFPQITKNEIKFSMQNFEWEELMKNTIEKYEKLYLKS